MNVRTFVAVGVVNIALILCSACGSEGKIGEECEESGQTEDECESGAVCGTNTGGTLVCLKVCTEQADCAGEEECNGVEGSSVKGCRLKSGGGKK